ncbi:DUF92 domain-containing protein [Adhaeribacter radiodurans]|uniref:DUF92 domain-containing protein n=1 Tax=Adhaeribacter radiodurans TaxID=2745197 RepID=A0A7L7L4W4_9BACT|nr:DUF92 domain-containing protein [Adhaeribacter radiodurans]QMU27813.1 DUF92 domain-containing protein [Adhaeribacter radiodurans]
MTIHFWAVLSLLGLGMLMSVIAGKLTIFGAITGGLLGMAIYLGAGYTGIFMLGLFFILGTAATSWKQPYKQNLGLAEINKGRRTAGQAFANAGVAAILGLLAFFFPAKADLFRVMLAAGFASATSDTLSSELGNVYGRRFYHILTWQKGVRGLNGVISLEGTSFGMMGSALIGFLFGLGFGWSWAIVIIIIAGILGNFFDSVLGAALENKGYLSNDAVNLLNTLFAALIAGTLYLVIN